MNANQLFEHFSLHGDTLCPLFFAGVGSRESPTDVCDMFSEFARLVELKTQWTLRSGGAPGADLAFEKFVTRKEIFLPWKGFNKNPSPLFTQPAQAFEITSKYHPAWFGLPPAVKKLMARNAQQVLGPNLDTPSSFILCWTPDGATKSTSKATGGTGQAIRIANAYNIPVINVNEPEFINYITQNY